MLISNSEVSTFNDCERKHFFSHRKKMMPLASNAAEAIVRGIVGHDALDTYYQAKMKGDKKHQAVEAAKDTIFNYVYQYPQFTRMLKKLMLLIEAYAERYWDETLEVIESESARKVEAVFQGTSSSFVFRLDILAVMHMRGKYRNVLLDHKFVYDFWSPTKMKLSPQFPKYIKGLQLHGIDVEDVVLNQVRHRELKDGYEFRRTPLKEMPESHIFEVVSSHINTAEKITGYSSLPEDLHFQLAQPNYDPWRCDKCWFNPLCLSIVQGKGWEEVAEVMFTRNSYGYDEETSMINGTGTN